MLAVKRAGHPAVAPGAGTLTGLMPPHSLPCGAPAVRQKEEPMSQAKKRPAPRKAPRTVIEDLSQPVEELSEEEASLASGGLVVSANIGTVGA